MCSHTGLQLEREHREQFWNMYQGGGNWERGQEETRARLAADVMEKRASDDSGLLWLQKAYLPETKIQNAVA